MFSRSKQRGDKTKNRNNGNGRKEKNLSQLGLLDVPDVDEFAVKDDGDLDDDDLEAELLALAQGTSTVPSRSARRSAQVPKYELNFDEKEDSDSDLDDPELLAELEGFVTENSAETPPTAPSRMAPNVPTPVVSTPAPMQAGASLVQLLSDRIKIYEEAIENATASGEMSRVRRFKRGLKSLEGMLKSARAGKAVNEDDIPPMISVRSAQPSPAPDYDNSQASTPASGSSATSPLEGIVKPVAERPKQDFRTQDTVMEPIPASIPQPSAQPIQQKSEHTKLVESRLHEYKIAALKAKKEGNLEEAMNLLRTAKRIEPLLVACEENQDVDLSSLPPKVSDITNPAKSLESEESVTRPVPSEESLQQAPEGPPTPTTALEALEQRLAKYREQMTKAQNDGNARKERMNKRIMKQYQEAITQVKAGRLVDFDELPTPPGYAPIPLPGNSAPTSGAQSNPSANPEPSPQPKPQVTSPEAPTKPQPTRVAPVPQKAGSSGTNVRNAPKSRVERQLSILQARQKLFRESALDAKKRGEIEQAKEYLRNSKGIDNLIAATQGGLPVDMNTVPIPPQETLASFETSSNFEMVSKEDCDTTTITDADAAHTYTKLENDLVEQIKMCARTRQHFKALGDVASANRFEQLILHSKKDLDSVRAGFTRGDSPPKFHYETRSFTMIQCNTDLTDSDLEFSIVRGINYNVPNPKEVDTYVKIEFPYPSESPPQDKTEVVKDTNCPEYNHKTTFSIDRKSRSAVRIFKRQGIKCQVITRGRWFHRDTVLGYVKVPLLPLENKCTLHESYDLIDEKKKMVGGKLEAKIRLRNPILSKQLEKVTEKWLVIDGF